MKRINRYLFVLAVLGLCAAGPARALDEKIAFIDLDKVFNEYYKTKLADKQLKEQAKDFNEEREGLLAEYEDLQGVFNTAREDAQNTALSEEVRNSKRNEAEEKLIELREFENKIRNFDTSRKKQLEDQSRRMRKRIVEEIRQNIQTFARNQGYDAVLDSSGESFNGVPMIVYHDEKLDITAEMIDLINKGKE